MGELLVPALLMVAFTVTYYLLRPDPERARRIERYLRSWVYLADRDLILIHDRLTLSKGGLRPRWLLHSQHEPGISRSSFVVPGEFADLHGRVMLPLDANLQSVGGPGFEFFVDRKNYDQDGKALKSAS